MNKHTASVVRENIRKLYKAEQYYSSGETYVSSYGDFIENEVLWSGELDSPVLEKGDEFFIGSTKEVVRINKVIRSSDNSYIYFTGSNYIKDEISEESKAKAEEDKVKLEEKAAQVNNNKNDYIQNNFVSIEKKIDKMSENVESIGKFLEISKQMLNTSNVEELENLLKEIELIKEGLI